MRLRIHRRLDCTCPCLSRLASVVAALAGAVVLAGWTLDVTALEGLLHEPVPMRPDTALGFLAAGAALHLLGRGEPTRRARRAARLCALLVIGVGAAALAIELLEPRLTAAWPPLRLAYEISAAVRAAPLEPTPALHFLVLGTILLWLDVPRATRAVQLLTFALGFAGLLDVVGYGFDLAVFHGAARHSHLTVDTGFLFVLLSAGVLCARPQRGLMALLNSSGLGGMMARRLLPATIGVPLVLGWLGLQGERAGLFDAPIGLCLMMLSSMAAFTAITWRSALSLENKEHELRRSRGWLLREAAQRRLAEQTAVQLAAIVESSPDAIVGMTLDGTITSWNAGAEAVFGFEADEVRGRSMAMLIPAERAVELERLLDAARRGDRLDHYESESVRKDGQRIHVSLSSSPIRDPEGSIVGAAIIARDVSEPKRAARALQASEARLAGILDIADDAIISVDETQHIILYNQGAERAFGWSAEEALGMHLERLLPARAREAHREHVGRFAASGIKARRMGQPGDVMALHQDGHEFPAEISISRLELDGKTIHTVMLRDITERIRSTKAVQESQAQLQAILDNTAAVIYLKDVGGRYIFANRRFETLFHVTQAALQGKTDHDLFPREMADRFRSNDLQVLETGAPLEFEETAPHDDGIHTYVSIKFPMRHADGSIFGVCGTSTDITDRLQVHKELETLLHVVSHDLKEPLRAIESFTSIVRTRYSHVVDGKGRDILERIVNAAARLRVLLDDVARLSRVRRVESPAQHLDSRLVVREALARLEEQIEQTGAEVRVADDLPLLHADRTWAIEAIYNLVSNALKYVAPGAPPRIEIAGFHTEGPEGADAGLVVRDRGPGVPAEHGERIFQLFQRAVGREVEGTGAGLAIVRAVAERHGGHAWVRPRPGGGSEFFISFSARPPLASLPRAA